jgi:L,D-transpeptidase ErfK/SrfK
LRHFSFRTGHARLKSVVLWRIVPAVALALLTSAPGMAQMVVGGETLYTVRKGDSLPLVGARNGVFWRNIALDNNLDGQSPLSQGLELRLNTRRIVPRVLDTGIVINIPDRTLYFFKDGTLMFFPVGVGSRPVKDGGDWRTPTGRFSVISKRRNPTWHVPPSILLENRLKGIELEEEVKPGPKNPLGAYAIETSIPGVLIHSTIFPGSVYRYSSHGCLRMLPEHMAQFYTMVERGTKGEIIYEPVKLATTETGRIFLEARTDVYKRSKPLKDEAARIIESRGLSGKVDWLKVGRVVHEERGVAEDITLPLAEPVVSPARPTASQDKRFSPWRILDIVRFRSRAG